MFWSLSTIITLSNGDKNACLCYKQIFNLLPENMNYLLNSIPEDRHFLLGSPLSQRRGEAVLHVPIEKRFRVNPVHFVRKCTLLNINVHINNTILFSFVRLYTIDINTASLSFNKSNIDCYSNAIEPHFKTTLLMRPPR